MYIYALDFYKIRARVNEPFSDLYLHFDIILFMADSKTVTDFSTLSVVVLKFADIPRILSMILVLRCGMGSHRLTMKTSHFFSPSHVTP